MQWFDLIKCQLNQIKQQTSLSHTWLCQTKFQSSSTLILKHQSRNLFGNFFHFSSAVLTGQSSVVPYHCCLKCLKFPPQQITASEEIVLMWSRKNSCKPKHNRGGTFYLWKCYETRSNTINQFTEKITGSELKEASEKSGIPDYYRYIWAL